MELNLFAHISSLFESLSKKVDTLAETKKIAPVPLKSLKLDQLGIALAKAQAEMPIAELNKNNPYFKSSYADLKSIVVASRPSLTKYGLSITQNLFDDEDNSSWIETMLLHGASDQWICSRKRVVPAKNDIQTISSHTTYLKRLCYAALIGVVTGDEDDDGEQAALPYREIQNKGVALNTKYNPKEVSPEVITKEQLDELQYELTQYPDIAEMVMDGLKINSISDMPKSKFMAAVTRIREIKNLRNNGPKK